VCVEGLWELDRREAIAIVVAFALLSSWGRFWWPWITAHPNRKARVAPLTWVAALVVPFF
jgi:hypothetical protein